MNTNTLKCNLVKSVCAISAAILCGAARAEEPVGDKEAAASAEAAAEEEEESSVVQFEGSMKIDSKYLSYGFVDNNEPIFTLDATLTLFDHFYIEAETFFDLTRYGRRAGYRDRAFKAFEFHPQAGLYFEFDPEDYEWLPTKVVLDINYDYEYHPRCCRPEDCSEKVKDTQFWTVYLSMPDLWCEPKLTYERDVIRDNGTYLNLELGHTFNLVEDTLDFRPAISQGWGDRKRVRAYAERMYGHYWESDEEEEEEWLEENWCPYDHNALLDTVVKGELIWTINDYFKLSAYVGYSDFLFDEGVRDAARNYEATGDWGHSWNVLWGVALSASF